VFADVLATLAASPAAPVHLKVVVASRATVSHRTPSPAWQPESGPWLRKLHDALVCLGSFLRLVDAASGIDGIETGLIRFVINDQGRQIGKPRPDQLQILDEIREYLMYVCQ
jgi:hypothetical protein